MKLTRFAIYGFLALAGLGTLTILFSGAHDESAQPVAEAGIDKLDAAGGKRTPGHDSNESQSAAATNSTYPKSNMLSQGPLPNGVYTDDQAVATLDNMLARFAQGDESLTDRELADFESRLAATVEHSESGRALLKSRFMQAVEAHDFLAIYQLERAFASSEVGIEALLDVYDHAVGLGTPPVDSYVLQGLTSMNEFLTPEERNLYAADSVTQLAEYSDFAERSPGLQFLRSALEYGTYDNVDPELLALANQQVTNIHQQAESGSSEQYSSARTLLSMASPENSARLAQNFLNADPSESHVNAVMWGIDTGAVVPSDRLIASLQLAIAQGNASPRVVQIAANWFPSWEWPEP